MIGFAYPNEDEIELLKQHYRKTPGTVSQRAHAVLLSAKGWTAYDTAQVLFLTEKTVREWIKRWHRERMASIFSKNHCNENAAKLTKEQKQEIAKVLSQPPSEYGLPKEFWEVKSLRKYLLAEFGVEYKSDNSYRFIFKLHHYSFHLPAKFDIHRHERIIRERLMKIKETIFPLLSDPKWEVLAADEGRLIWDNASFHRSKKLKQKLKTSLKAFYLLNLPPYAPDTNPQEHIWKYAKDEISNYQCATIEEMTERFKSIVMGRSYPYQI
jgi:transposase